MLFNTVVQFIGRAVALLISLLMFRLVTTYLGVDAFGEYAIVIAISEILLVVCDFGIATVLVREAARHPDRMSEFGVTLLWIRVVGSTALVFLALGVIPNPPLRRDCQEWLGYRFHKRSSVDAEPLSIAILSSASEVHVRRGL